MSEAAKKAFGWPAELRHAPQPPDEERGGFRSVCRCGYEGRWTKASPSHAYQHTLTHATTENAREEGGGKPADFTAAPSRPSVVSPRASQPRAAAPGGTPCGCGCGEPSGGLFRPGHDSKLLSRLLATVKSGGLTAADALAEVAKVGGSDRLASKLQKRIDGAGICA